MTYQTNKVKADRYGYIELLAIGIVTAIIYSL